MKLRAVVLTLAAAVVAAAMVVPATTVPVVTGHTTFADMESMDPCLGAIAGLVQREVLWFDDSIYHQRTNFEDDQWIYASEEEAPDPTFHVKFDNVTDVEGNADDQPADKVLIRSGVWYNFTDPNEVAWNVTEVYWDEGHYLDEGGGSEGEGGDAESAENSTAGTNRHYAWIVELGPTTEDPYLDGLDGMASRYNFVNMINTCKFSEEAEEDGTRHHTAGDDDPAFRHPEKYNTTHNHTEYTVQLRVGDEPDLVPLDAEPAHQVHAKNVVETMNEVRSR